MDESEPVVIEYEEPEIEKADDVDTEEKNNMELKAIAVYDAYFMLNGKLKGIDGDKIVNVDAVDADDQAVTLDAFFKKDGVLYMSTQVMEAVDSQGTVETLCFKQSGSIIKAIDSLPAEPNHNRATMIDGNFSIQDFDYDGTICSEIKQSIGVGMEPLTRFKFVDGYLFTDDGLWFSVFESGRTNEKDGVYFWAKNSGRFEKRSEYGMIW